MIKKKADVLPFLEKYAKEGFTYPDGSGINGDGNCKIQYIEANSEVSFFNFGPNWRDQEIIHKELLVVIDILYKDRKYINRKLATMKY